MRYLALTLVLLGTAYRTFVPGMYPCPFTIVCTYTHTYHGDKGEAVHNFTVQFPYGTTSE